MIKENEVTKRNLLFTHQRTRNDILIIQDARAQAG